MVKSRDPEVKVIFPCDNYAIGLFPHGKGGSDTKKIVKNRDRFLMYNKVPDVPIKQIWADCLNMEPFTSYSVSSGEL